MDWEKKFQSIVEETEANLAKVKMTLSKGGTLSNSSSIPTGSLNYWPTKLSPLVSDPVFPENLVPSLWLKPTDHSSYTSALSPLPQTVSWPADSYNQEISLSEKALKERLERQNKAIERLSKAVERLECERDEYRDHIRELQHQVRHVTSRLSDSSLESTNDRRLELWKREVMAELDSVHNQLRNHVKTGSGNQFSDSQMLQHSRDLLELRRSQREDTDSLRKDIDGLKSRISRLEQRVTESESQRSRNMQNKLEKSCDVSCYHGNRSLGKMEMTELRTNVSCLKHKVDALEMLMLSSGTGNGRKENEHEGSRKQRNTRLPLVDLLSDDDDLHVDLADNDDSSELSLAPKPNLRQDTCVYDSDEELDLNDLDLSDDKDDLSDDDILTVDDI